MSDTTTSEETPETIQDQMTATCTAAVDSHLEAYATADADRRIVLMCGAWESDGALIDPPFDASGHAGIASLTDAVLSHYPGHRFQRTTHVDLHHGFGRYGWRLVAPDSTVAVSGTDFVEFTADGKLRRVVGFFGDLNVVVR